MNDIKNKQDFKIVFAGTPKFAEVILNKLIEAKFNISAVYTQPDKPKGRGLTITACETKLAASKAGISVHQPSSFKDEEELEKLAFLKPDLMIVVAYGMILPEKVLQIPRLGCINIHASLLPKLRGAAPIQRAIELGEQNTGITIMQMDAGLDTGDIITTSSCPISSTDTSESLHSRLALLGAETLVEILPNIINEKIELEKQNNDESSYAKKITKSEADIIWTEDAQIIERKIRAFYPWPVCYSSIDNTKVKIIEATVLNEKSTQLPGTIVNDKKGIDVCTSSNVLRIEKLQLPGGKKLAASDVLNSNNHMFSKYKIFQNTTA